MLMFISFPVIADEWVELGSLASSRNDALAINLKYSKTGSACQVYFQGTCPGFAKSSASGTGSH